MSTKHKCVSCRDNPLMTDKPAVVQVCGYDLCSVCHDMAVTTNKVSTLHALASAGVRTCYHTIWRMS